MCALLLFAAIALISMGWCAANVPIERMWPLGRIYSEQAKRHPNYFDTTKPHPQGRNFSFVCYAVAICLAVLALSQFINVGIKKGASSEIPSGTTRQSVKAFHGFNKAQ